MPSAKSLPWLLLSAHNSTSTSKMGGLSSRNKTGLLVPLIRVHDLIDDVSLRPHNPINDAILYGIWGLHVEWPLHVLQLQGRERSVLASNITSRYEWREMLQNKKQSKSSTADATH